MSVAMEREQEFQFGQADFAKLQSLVYEKTGIVLKDQKKNMVYGRLARRLRTLKLSAFSDYINFIETPAGADEMGNLINAITTNLTKFFREDHHFEHFRSVAMKESFDALRSGKQKRIRVWSAGCSSGEEPYSIAMSMVSAIPKIEKLDAKILATDLDTNMLDTGRAGLYKSNCLDTISKEYTKRFTKIVDDGYVQISPKLRQFIAFKQLNLLHNWPMKGPFDVIFCRNVMIYFDNPTKQRLVDGFASMLRPGGWLYIGHSESLLNQSGPFKLHGRTTYRKEL
ncbi:CheR family methyltransferase [Curvivirga sp.]|uniref:CheR family methyltransferase n=1 Tax=Curvivirga sp. TaxID=2856848 RepID=UPI003B5B2D9A